MKFLEKIKMYFTLNKTWLEELELFKTNFTLAKDIKIIFLNKKIVKFNQSFLNFLDEQHLIIDTNWYDFLNFDETKLNSSYILKLKNKHTKEDIPLLVTSSSFSINKKTYINITLKDLSETELAKTRLNFLIEASKYISDGVVITDVNGNIQWVNKVVLDLYGYTEEELIGKKTSIFKSGLEDDSKYEAMWKAALSNKIWEGDIVNVSKSDLIRLVKLIIIPITSDDEVTNFVGIQNVKSPITLLFQNHSEERLKILFEKIDFGFFIFKATKDKTSKVTALKLEYNNPFGANLLLKFNSELKGIFKKDKKFWLEIASKLLKEEIVNSFQLDVDKSIKIRIYNFRLNEDKIISIILPF